MPTTATPERDATLRFVPADKRPLCEMCFIEDAIANQGTVPVCDGCIVEYGIDPFSTARMDGLPNQWVSPAQHAKSTRSIGQLVSTIGAARLRLAIIGDWSRLPEGAPDGLTLDAILAATDDGLAGLAQRVADAA